MGIADRAGYRSGVGGRDDEGANRMCGRHDRREITSYFSPPKLVRRRFALRDPGYLEHVCHRPGEGFIRRIKVSSAVDQDVMIKRTACTSQPSILTLD